MTLALSGLDNDPYMSAAPGHWPGTKYRVSPVKSGFFRMTGRQVDILAIFEQKRAGLCGVVFLK
jgi:hypothetical protein